jgi:hypothetical protein
MKSSIATGALMIFYFYAAIILILVAGWQWLFGSADPQTWLPVWAVCLMLALGLLLRRLWVQHVLLGIAASSSVAWLATVIAIAWKGWPYSDLLHSVVSLIPGIVWIGGQWGLFLLIQRAFRQSALTRPSHPDA